MAVTHDPLALPTALAQLREIQSIAAGAIQAGTLVACETALDRIADLACDGHDDDDDDDPDDDDDA